VQRIDTGTEDLQAHVEDGVAVLVLSRRERRNALTPAMLAGLACALTDVEADDDVGAVVLTGAGGAFCAGGDVEAMAQEGAPPSPAAAQVGLAGDYGGAWFLTRLVGTGRARELMLFAERLDAPRALELGLVNDVLPDDALLPEVLERARRLAAGPRVALGLMKRNLGLALTADLEDMDVEVAHHTATKATADHAEAARAFVERRPAQFSGR
jgi:2-(1,2-epoxy-1,2-dihydrophenyl)acetyl-CoA isomerase